MTNEQIKELLKNPNDKLIAVDLDEVLCHGEFWGDEEPKPNVEMIAKVWDWYKRGAHIVIYTARQPKWYAVTLAWLLKYEVPFHGIAMMAKIGADCYIDDKAISVDEL